MRLDMRIAGLALLVAIWLAAIFLTNSVDCGFSSAKAVQGFIEDSGFQRDAAIPARLIQIQSVGIDLRAPLRSRTDFSDAGNAPVRDALAREGICFTALVPLELPQTWQFTLRTALQPRAPCG
jgi:hypothetical protein